MLTHQVAFANVHPNVWSSQCSLTVHWIMWFSQLVDDTIYPLNAMFLGPSICECFPSISSLFCWKGVAQGPCEIVRLLNHLIKRAYNQTSLEYEFSKKHTSNLTFWRNGLEFLSTGSGVNSALPLCLGNHPLEMRVAAFLEEPPFGIVFLTIHVSRITIGLPSQFFMPSLWSLS